MANEGLKFSWATEEGTPEVQYEVTLKEFREGPAPTKFTVKNSEGVEYICHKTERNFLKLYEELKSYFPQWNVSKLQKPATGDMTKEEAWKAKVLLVNTFLEDYKVHKNDPLMEKIGNPPECRVETIGEHIRYSFRCLFFMRRDAEMDALEKTGKWKIEQSMNFTNAKGNKLFMRHWNPYDPKTMAPMPDADPKAVAILMHGYADQGDSESMVTFAKATSAAGFITYSLDIEGCGRSEGLRMYTRNYRDYLDDHKLLFDAVKKKHTGKKFFLIGQSMGGGFATMTSIDWKDEAIAGVVLLAPMVKVADSQSPLMQRLAPLLAALIPNTKIVTLDIETLTHDPYHQRRHAYQAYGYTEKVVTCTGFQMLKFTQDAQRKLHEMRSPFIVFHGTADAVTDMKSSVLLHEKAEAEDKILETVEGAFHELLMEPDHKEKVLGRAVSWMTTRT